MSSFTDPLEFKHIGYGVHVTQKRFRFYLSDTKTGEYVEVPAGFVSNGASIPAVLRGLFGWSAIDQRWAQAAFLHDALVGESGSMLPIQCIGAPDRYATWSEAANWFDAALRVSCPNRKRFFFVLAVRLWGIPRQFLRG